VRATLIAVGSELLFAGRRDTNGDWLAERLEREGVEVIARDLVVDDPGAIAEHVRSGLATGDWVLVTGGLGPTEDDRTREGIARAIGARLERDADVAREIRARFASRGRPCGEHQLRQAERPAGAAWLANPTGTAPGFRVDVDGATVVALPGVPSEMRAMFDAALVGRFGAGSETRVRRTYKIGGRYESSVDRAIEDLYARPGVTITILASIPGIELHVVATGASPGEAERRLGEVAGEIERRLPDDLYGVDDDTLARIVGRRLVERQKTVATAESCTAGLVAAELTSVPGSSRWFRGGLLVYADDLKERLAGVDPAVLAAHGAVSPEVAAQLARGAARATGADLGVGITGVAGPGGGSQEKPVGTVHLALWDSEGTETHAFRFPGDRDAVRGRTVAWALDRLRRRLGRT
jgi:nicotinamide-nucleotide amidase